MRFLSFNSKFELWKFNNNWQKDSMKPLGLGIIELFRNRHMELIHREPADYIRQIGSRLKILHMHENDAIGDLHQMPYTFGAKPDDGVDWEDFCKALVEIGFDGTLSFETFPYVNSFPRGAREEVLRTIRTIGEDMVENIA